MIRCYPWGAIFRKLSANEREATGVYSQSIICAPPVVHLYGVWSQVNDFRFEVFRLYHYDTLAYIPILNFSKVSTPKNIIYITIPQLWKRK